MAKILLVILFIISCTGCAAKGPFRYPSAMWMSDKDRIPIEMPPSTEEYSALDVADKEIFAEFAKAIAIAHGVAYTSSSFVSGRQEALNINNFDQTFDSTWFTNRLGKYNMSIGEIIKGPKKGSGPDLSSPLRVKSAKVTGVIPRLLVEDRKGKLYNLKFDPPHLPGLSTSSELITSTLMHAMGYNVPENYLINIRRNSFVLDIDAKTRGKYGKIRDMTKEDLNQVLDKIMGADDTKSVRAIASKLFKGKILGPFSFNGRRYGDKNDRIPHEHRRELRGYRVFSSFFNNIDSVPYDTLDTFVTVEDDKGYLVHHFFDLSSTFGGVGSWQEKPREWDNKTSGSESLMQGFTLGLYDPKKKDLAFEDKGFLGIAKFNPAKWNTAYPNAAFAYMTPRDAFWAANILMQIPDKAIETVVKSARYPNEKIEKYVIRTLIARKNKIGRYWFDKINPLDNFVLTQKSKNITIDFEDLYIKYNFGSKENTSYRYSLRTQYGRADLTDWVEFKTTPVTINSDIMEIMDNGRIYLLKVETKREGDKWYKRPVDLYIKKEHNKYQLLGFIKH